MATLNALGLDQTLVMPNLMKGWRTLATPLSTFTTDFSEGVSGQFGRVQTSIPLLGSGSIKNQDGVYADTTGTGSQVYVDLDKEVYVQVPISTKDVTVYGWDKAVEFAGMTAYKAFVNTIQNEAFGQLVSGSTFPTSVGSGSALADFGYNNLVDGWVALSSGSVAELDGEPTAILGLKAFGATKKDTKNMQTSGTSLGTSGIGSIYKLDSFGNVVANHRVASTTNQAATGSWFVRGVLVKPAALAVVSKAAEEPTGASNALVNDVVADPEIGNFRFKVIYDEVGTGKAFVRLNAFFTAKVCVPNACVFLVTTGVGETAG